MTDRDLDSLMLAYVYGELSDDDARAFEQRLAADAGLRAEVDGLLATRELLGEDARYGESSGADLPPPHLLDAILRAEVLARPTEIRQAHAAGGAAGGWLSRLSLWVVGGSVAATAAAALLFVAKDESSLEPEMLAPSPIAAEAPAASPAADPPAAAKASPAEERQAEPSADEEKLEVHDRPSDKKASKDADEKPSGTGMAFGDGDEAADGLVRELKQKVHKRDALGAGDAEPFAPEDETVSSRGIKGGATGALQERSEAEADDADTLSFGSGRVGSVSKNDYEGAPAAEPTVASPERPAPKSAPVDSSSPPPAASSPRGALGGGAGGLGAPSAAQPPGPPPLPAHLRQQLAKKRAERARKPSKEQGFAAEAQKKHTEQLEMSLMTAERELQEGRPKEALDLFQSVSRQDPRGALVGIVPYVGQMRALEVLKRHPEVLALLPLVRRPGITAKGVPEGLQVAARSAEATGNLTLARELYRELLVVKDKRQEAEKALARLNARPALREKAAAEAAPAEASMSDEP